MLSENLILEQAVKLLPIFLNAHEKKLGDRKGIYLMIVSKGKTTPIGRIIGVLPPEKVVVKADFAREKIKRIMLNDHQYSSFESQNIAEMQFGGAIVTNNFIFSASGFPPALDEKFVLLLALMVSEISFQDAGQIEMHRENAEASTMK